MKTASGRPDVHFRPFAAPVVHYLPVPDLVELDEPDDVVSELLEPLVDPDVPPLVEPGVVVPPPAAPLEVPEPLVLGDERVVDPLIPPVPGLEAELPVSRPSVESRSEHAPRPSVASAAATATPIARVLICFIHYS